VLDRSCGDEMKIFGDTLQVAAAPETGVNERERNHAVAS
jgi:hypothetical protein